MTYGESSVDDWMVAVTATAFGRDIELIRIDRHLHLFIFLSSRRVRIFQIKVKIATSGTLVQIT